MSNLIYNFINNGGILLILIIAIIGIAIALMGMVLWFVSNGFDLWLAIFDVFIVIFSGWALYVGAIKPVMKNPELFNLK